MIFHSNLNLYIFQHYYRNQIWMEFLRLLSYIIHCSLFLFPIIGLIFWNNKSSLHPILIPILLTFLYFTIVQRALEERYTYPFLAILFIQSIHVLFTIKNYLQNRKG